MNGNDFFPPIPPEPVQVPETESKEKKAIAMLYRALSFGQEQVEATEIAEFQDRMQGEIGRINDDETGILESIKMELAVSQAQYKSGDLEQAIANLESARDEIGSHWPFFIQDNKETVRIFLEDDIDVVPDEQDLANPRATAEFISFWAMVLSGLLKMAKE